MKTNCPFEGKLSNNVLLLHNRELTYAVQNGLPSGCNICAAMLALGLGTEGLH